MVGTKRKGMPSDRNSIEKTPTRQTPPRRLKNAGRVLYHNETNDLSSCRNIEFNSNITSPKEINIEAAKRMEPEIRKGQEVWDELRDRGWKALKDGDILGDYVFVAPERRTKTGTVEGVTRYTGYRGLSDAYHRDGNSINGILRRAEEAVALEKGGLDSGRDGDCLPEVSKQAMEEASDGEVTQVEFHDFSDTPSGMVTDAVSMSPNDDATANDDKSMLSKEEKEFLRLKKLLDSALDTKDEFSVRFYTAALNRFLSRMEN
eukprot:CAMPEP_0172502524 /NCGR_PEP_ID=MMETSP1066-20121228/160964_1 /TAXON_ID=671091 /ORGANISM="Coscinodiscus wailesii, Strain CCMP2513" /LENGTH=260 /DNA_ID=CAMNT_0013277819 /DNA_START=117 /DNA_END=899 /DNA_ORIENTATION=+